MTLDVQTVGNEGNIKFSVIFLILLFRGVNSPPSLQTQHMLIMNGLSYAIYDRFMIHCWWYQHTGQASGLNQNSLLIHENNPSNRFPFFEPFIKRNM